MARQRKGATRHQSEHKAPRLPLRRVAMVALPLLLLATASAGGWWLFNPHTLPVTTVRVETPLQHVDREVIRQAVVPHVQNGWLRVDVAAIQKELDALPWVAHSAVRRDWPDRLLVAVQEQQPAARWQRGGMLNLEGESFEVEVGGQWQQLPLLSGPEQTERLLMREFRAMQALVAPLGLQVARLQLDQRRAWSVVLDNGLHLRLGRKDREERLSRFARVYTAVLQPRLEAIESVDLRYTNGFAVRWREGAAAA